MAVTVDEDGCPPVDALVTIVNGRAVALRTDVGYLGTQWTWTTYEAQAIGAGCWEYVTSE